jgi:hypothetical protein
MSPVHCKHVNRYSDLQLRVRICAFDGLRKLAKVQETEGAIK